MKHSHKSFPATRYQGSKFKLLDWLEQHFSSLHFDRALDAFSGTSSVSYLLKSQNKQVVSNDLLRFNSVISKALIENNDNKIDKKDISFIFNDQGINYYSFIQDNFSDIYYTDQENIWLDRTIQNIGLIDNEYKRAMLLWCLFQSCITKRPYGLFHRKNLHIRTKDVERSFGNKKTWDAPFEDHFLKFSQQVNNAVFSTDSACLSINKNVFDIDNNDFDLVYLDPPYIPASGSLTKYGDFYHFLEGINFYNEWPSHLDHNKKHLPFFIEPNQLEDKKENVDFLTQLFNKFKSSIIVMSYRSDGIPSEDEIFQILGKTHKKVVVNNFDHQYVLSKKKTKEVLFTAFPY